MLPAPPSTDSLLRVNDRRVTLAPSDQGWQVSLHNRDGSYRVEIAADPVTALRRVLTPR